MFYVPSRVARSVRPLGLALLVIAACAAALSAAGLFEQHGGLGSPPAQAPAPTATAARADADLRAGREVEDVAPLALIAGLLLACGALLVVLTAPARHRR